MTISSLRERITTVPHVKPKGRPKHSGILWPSKRKHYKKEEKACVDKENTILPAAKKVRLSSDMPGTCAYRSMILRKQQRKALNKVNDNAVIVDLTGGENGDSVNQNKIVAETAGIRLYESDITCLTSRCLNDSIIDFGQALIKEMCPSIGGFQPVIHSRTLTFKPEKEFIQVLNCDDAHWVCATNIGCKQNVVKVYDSWRTGDVTRDAKEAIANLLQSSHKRIYLLFPEVQQQRDGSSCGVFALAFAHTLAERKDPSSLEFSDEASLRAHLLKCVTAKKMAPFYTRQALYKPGKVMKSVMKIYCTCRLPDSGDEMVQCGKCTEWYHFTCVGISPGTKLKSAYYCSVCNN